MQTPTRFTLFFSLAVIAAQADSVRQPVLQWVQVFGGSGTSTVVGAVPDAKGNLYIAGYTSSADFPVTNATQGTPGSSTLVRINAAGTVKKLFPPGLSSVNSAAIDPGNPSIVYATQANAVWQSTDGGDTWKRLTPFSSNTLAVSVAVDPFDSNILYVATSTTGIFKSTDGGMTWTAMSKGIPVANDGSFETFRVWTDPMAPNAVLAATGNPALVRSLDGGANWTVAINSAFVQTLSFDPLSPGTLYIAASGTIAKSADEGKTFLPVSSLPGGAVANAVVADPVHEGVLYAAANSGIYQSSDSGATWTQKTNRPCLFMTADPKGVLYASVVNLGVIRSTDGFSTFAVVSPFQTSLKQMVAGGGAVFLVSNATSDAFVVKLDLSGAIVYSTYFGGSGDDSASGLAVGKDGSVYVAGRTSSTDFPTTAGVYAAAQGNNFIFKLNPDGSRAWATYFADAGSPVDAIAVGSDGSVYIGGNSGGGLPATPGAYQTTFVRVFPCGGIGPCIPGPTSAYVTKFKADGSALVYSTYVSTDSKKSVIASATSLLVDESGSVIFAGAGNLVRVSADGSALLASTGVPAIMNAIARDASGNIYGAGNWSVPFPGPQALPFATANAFQSAPQPPTPSLPGQGIAGGLSNAFVVKFDPTLGQILAATLLGGEQADQAEGISVVPSGIVIVSGYTDSRAFPLRDPFQTTFSSRAGFVAGFDPNLTQLLFSTYLGDGRPFAAQAAVPDGNGNILLAGSTLGASSLFIGGDPGQTFQVGNLVVANKIALPTAPAVRLDTVVNAASRMASPLAPSETIVALGAGFGSDAQLLVDGSPLTLLSVSPTAILAVMPDNAAVSGGHQLQVSSGGAMSNPVVAPAAPASPGLFSVDRSGFGQGYILNADGTLNSPSNPAVTGAPITLFATGAGAITKDGVFAITTQPVAVFVDGFYADGIAAFYSPVAGLPGLVYQIKIYVPDPASRVASNPNLLNFKFPPQVGVKLIFGTVNSSNPDNSVELSQGGLVLNIKQ